MQISWESVGFTCVLCTYCLVTDFLLQGLSAERWEAAVVGGLVIAKLDVPCWMEWCTWNWKATDM